MSTQDKLVEALRVAREWLNSDKWRNSTIDKHKSWEAMMRGIDAALAEYDAHADEAAQAQASVADGFIAERVNMGRGDERYIGTAEGTLGVTVRYGDPGEVRNDLLWLIADAMLAAAPRQAAESIKRVIERMNAMRWAGFSDVPLKVVANWATDLSVAIGETPFDGVAHDTHPQPAQDAKDAARYRWLREQHNMPIRSWHVRTPSNDVPEIEGLDDAIDAAMTQESGNG